MELPEKYRFLLFEDKGEMDVTQVPSDPDLSCFWHRCPFSAGNVRYPRYKQPFQRGLDSGLHCYVFYPARSLLGLGFFLALFRVPENDRISL